MVGRRQTGRRRTNRLSLVFAALAIVLAAAAVFLLVRDDGQQESAPPPAVAGENEMVHVLEALRAEGLEANFARGSGVSVGELMVPGQRLVVDGAPLFVFRYQNPGDAADDFAAADPAAILPDRSATGTPIADGTPFVTSHSNVTVALVGGSNDVQEKVDRAIQGLP